VQPQDTVPGRETGYLTSNSTVQHFGVCIRFEFNNKIKQESPSLFLMNFYGEAEPMVRLQRAAFSRKSHFFDRPWKRVNVIFCNLWTADALRMARDCNISLPSF